MSWEGKSGSKSSVLWLGNEEEKRGKRIRGKKGNALNFFIQVGEDRLGVPW